MIGAQPAQTLSAKRIGRALELGVFYVRAAGSVGTIGVMMAGWS